MEAGLVQVQEKDVEIKRLQRELEGYESQRERVQDQMVMELDDKKGMMDRLRAGKKKFKVRTMGGATVSWMLCLEGCYILLPLQAGIMRKKRHSHKDMEETKEEMKTMVRRGRV